MNIKPKGNNIYNVTSYKITIVTLPWYLQFRQKINTLEIITLKKKKNTKMNY